MFFYFLCYISLLILYLLALHSMTRIVSSKSKFCLRYDTDFWNNFLSPKPRIHKAFRYFFSLGRPVAWRNIKRGPLIYNLFSDITRTLYQPISHTSFRFSSELRNRVRVRYFFGGITNQKLKSLGKYALVSGRKSNNLYTISEGFLFCFLFRVNFFQTFTEMSRLKKFVELGAFSINNKPVFNLFNRVHIGDIVQPSNYEWYCFFYLYFVLLVLQKKLARRMCSHILPDYKLLQFLFYKAPERKDVAYTLGIDLPSALLYYRKPPRMSPRKSF